MATTDWERHRQWQTGGCRVMSASWAAIVLSYGLTADEINVLAEYFSLLASGLVNIALALGDSTLVDISDQIL